MAANPAVNPGFQRLGPRRRAEIDPEKRPPTAAERALAHLQLPHLGLPVRKSPENYNPPGPERLRQKRAIVSDWAA